MGFHLICYILAYGWRAGNLNWPIRIQQAGKALLSPRQCKLTRKALKSSTFSHWRWHWIFTKEDWKFPKPYRFAKSENYETFLSPTFNLAPKIVVRPASPGRVIVVLFWTKYAVPRQIEPRNLKLNIKRGQSNFSIVFIFISFGERGYHRVVSVGQLRFDCRSYCGLSRRMQVKGEDKTKKGNVRHVTEDNDFAFTVQLGARDLPTVAIELGGVRLEGVLVDSGSTCNVIDRETWEVLRKKKIKRNCTLMARRNHSTLPVSLKLNCVVKIDNVLHVSLLWKRRQGQYPADRPLNCWQYWKSR